MNNANISTAGLGHKPQSEPILLAVFAKSSIPIIANSLRSEQSSRPEHKKGQFTQK